MSLLDLLATAKTLCRADKIRLVQYLVDDLAREEGVASLETGAAYPIWTPVHAFEAAATMLETLDKQTTEP